MQKILCAGCAAKIMATVGDAFTVKRLSGGVDNKITCDQCGRRRYGGTYQIEMRSKANADRT